MRRGATVVETVVALLLGLLLVQVSLALLVRQRQAVDSLTRRAERLAAVRTGRILLGADLRALSGEAAALTLSSDTLALRVVRGLAVVCAEDGSGGVLVRAGGVRGPDAAKDSLLLLDLEGRWRPAALTSSDPWGGPPQGSRARACPDGPATHRWRIEPAVAFRVARYFERGSYHLRDGALRYRRGRSGRQPLTPPVVPPGSAFSFGPDGSASWTVPAGSSDRVWRARLGR
ncbi:MAG: hypothetical protein RJQ04_21595 [Longimicrobiales bacterium]